MSSRPSRWIILPVMLFAGCGEDVTVVPELSTAQSRELTPVEFATLEFIHDTLADRLRRIDTLARGVGLPSENTIEWSRRPPNANDGRKLHSYVAQWSTTCCRKSGQFVELCEPQSVDEVRWGLWSTTTSTADNRTTRANRGDVLADGEIPLER